MVFMAICASATDVPTLAFDANDPDQATFIHEATRYYQIYDAETGRLIVQSAGFEPLGLHFTPAEIRALRQEPRRFDISTEYGRFRISNSVLAGGAGHAELLQVGLSLGAMDGALRRYLDLLRWRVARRAWRRGILRRIGWPASRSRRSLVSPTRRARSTSTVSATACPRAAQTMSWTRSRGRSTERWRGSNAPSPRCGNSARRSRTSCGRHLPRCAERSSWRCEAFVPDGPQGRSFGSQLEEIDKLNRLIDQILTMARAESGQIPLTFAPLDLPRLGAEVVAELEPLAETRGIALRSDVPRRHRHRRRRGLAAAAHAESARQRVEVHDRRRAGDVARLARAGAARLEVDDTGIGMSPDVLARLFEPFFRADPARSSTVDGAGLGLSLVKWIVDAHNGRIAVESRAGRGSAFIVWLPLSRIRDEGVNSSWLRCACQSVGWSWFARWVVVTRHHHRRRISERRQGAG